jgi:hypothetical protein
MTYQDRHVRRQNLTERTSQIWPNGRWRGTVVTSDFIRWGRAKGAAMTLYRIGSIMLVLSTFCLAIAIGLNIDFYILCSTICVLLAGQLYASGVKEERENHPAGRR